MAIYLVKDQQGTVAVPPRERTPFSELELTAAREMLGALPQFRGAEYDNYWADPSQYIALGKYQIQMQDVHLDTIGQLVQVLGPKYYMIDDNGFTGEVHPIAELLD